MKLGKAFSDSVYQEKTVRMKAVRDTGSWWLGTGRVLLFTTVLFVLFFVLIIRLFDLTVIRGRQFRLLADTNRTRELIRHAPRGLILDRTGKPLVTNIPQYRLITDQGTKTLTKEQGDALVAKGIAPGQFLEVDWRRQYAYESLNQVTGYTGELTEKELAEEYYQLRGYHAGDRIGRSGVEAVYEDKLRGRDGKELVEVDAGGKIIRVLGRQEEIPGQNITLSVDAAISDAAAAAFPAGEKGAIVVAKPSTGEILALFSSPTFSANAFSLGISQGEYNALITNPDQPMLNRAIAGTYPPGSTFKIIMGLAGLEEGSVKPDTTITDTGTITAGQFSFSNWYFTQYGKTDGVVDIVKAFQRSNDIFFYKVGEWVGITKIVKWARLAGIGKTLGIELPGEAIGLMPDPAWKAATFDSPADIAARSNEWYLGDTYNTSIGQGYVLSTPLQVNAWTNIIASNGKLCRPTVEKVQRVQCKDVGIKPETIKLIAQGLQEACAPGGTGWPLFNFTVKGNAIPVACKTGTAEFGDPKNRTHAWFTTFAPVPKEDIASQGDTLQLLSGQPEISITVLVEGAGEGSNVAAPVAKKIYEAWFGR